MMDVLFKRQDGSFVATINGLPYHVTPDDPIFAEAQAAGADAPFEPAPPPPEPEQIKAALQAGIAAHVDAVAGQRQYSSGVHCASYVASTNAAWVAEAAAFIAWRDEVWQTAAAMLAAWQPGDPVPELPDVIDALPEIVWP